MKKPYRTESQEFTTLTPMELFVLTMLGCGRISSIYEFKSRLLLSQGAIQPTLRRLQDLGFIAKSGPAGTLHRKQLALTDAGRDALTTKWTWGLGQALEADAESVLRVAWSAAQLDTGAAQQFLADAVEKKRQQSQTKMDEVKNFDPSIDDPDSPYRQMRKLNQAEQLDAEYRSLRAAENLLAKWIEFRSTTRDERS
jgi:DNA-binding MarR family transcriptional regulator